MPLQKLFQLLISICSFPNKGEGRILLKGLMVRILLPCLKAGFDFCMGVIFSGILFALS